jgi:tripartite-type tricarboxylate transporter receptor subunit TctC
MGDFSRRAILAGAGSVTLSQLVFPGFAQEQALKIIMPYAAGGSSDSVARLIAERLQASLGRSVIVENRTGAGGRIGLIGVKQAAPDGATLLFAAGSQIFLQPHLESNIGYEPFADLLPITQVMKFDQALAVGPQTPAKSVQELVAWVRANPDHTVYGSPGVGTAAHFAGAEFGRLSKLELHHVPYRGGTPAALQDLMAGRVPMYVAATPELMEHHKIGGIRIIATTDEARSPLLPEVPTFRESGIDVLAPAWWAVYAPAKTPPRIAERLNRAIVAVVQAPDIRARILALGYQPTGTTAAELMALQRADYDRWGLVVKASGFRLEP